MSLERVEEFALNLPPELGDQVVSYAATVAGALPDIFSDLGFEFSSEIADQVVFLAGVKKFQSILQTVTLTLSLALGNLEGSETSGIRIGSVRYARGSRDYRELHEAVSELDRYIAGLPVAPLAELSIRDLVLALIE